jgi:LPS sulfotransferase NodH
MVRPQDVIICSSGRTGSTLVATLLASTGACSGCLEFFDQPHVMPKDVLPRIGMDSIEQAKADLPAYMALIRKHWGSTSKAFCIKLHWPQYERWSKLGLDLDRYFPGARYIWCTRSNFVAQSVSQIRAMQTQSFVADMPAVAAPERPGFWKFMVELHNQIRMNEKWAHYFREHGITPYRVRYEAIDADYRGQGIKLLEWLGIPVGPIRKMRLRPALKRQRDELNWEWEDRFYFDLMHWYEQWEKQLPIEERRRIWGREPG